MLGLSFNGQAQTCSDVGVITGTITYNGTDLGVSGVEVGAAANSPVLPLETYYVFTDSNGIYTFTGFDSCSIFTIFPIRTGTETYTPESAVGISPNTDYGGILDFVRN